MMLFFVFAYKPNDSAFNIIINLLKILKTVSFKKTSLKILKHVSLGKRRRKRRKKERKLREEVQA